MNIKVLIVEDDPMVLEINKNFVNTLIGFKVIGTALTGREALRLIKELQPHLTLLDYFLPDASGISILREIRVQGMPTDVIMVTAAQDAETVQDIFRYGAIDYIVKPFRLERLKESLENYAVIFNCIKNKNSLKQSDIDRYIYRHNLTRAPEVPENRDNGNGVLPKGLNEITLYQVVLFLGRERGPFSADEVAEKMGISRVTARRYLEFLVQRGKVNVELQYGSVGRPIKKYCYVE